MRHVFIVRVYRRLFFLTSQFFVCIFVFVSFFFGFWVLSFVGSLVSLWGLGITRVCLHSVVLYFTALLLLCSNCPLSRSVGADICWPHSHSSLLRLPSSTFLLPPTWIKVNVASTVHSLTAYCIFIHVLGLHLFGFLLLLRLPPRFVSFRFLVKDQ